jgi:hypothetical protein
VHGYDTTSRRFIAPANRRSAPDGTDAGRMPALQKAQDSGGVPANSATFSSRRPICPPIC